MDACYVDGELVVPQPGGFYGGWITSRVAGPFKGGPGTAQAGKRGRELGTDPLRGQRLRVGTRSAADLVRERRVVEQRAERRWRARSCRRA